MSKVSASVMIEIGAESFAARFRHDVAPRSCVQLKHLLPYTGRIIHARWSGEAVWCPLSGTWPAGLRLPPECATSSPEPGDVLLFADAQSEPELLIVYGASRFACRSGPLEGNPVLTIDDGLDRLTEVGRCVLYGGAAKLRLECVDASFEAAGDLRHVAAARDRS